jgi:hypothetical protein
MDEKILKNIGIFIVGGLVILSWWLGWFSIIFYLLGLYGAVYVVSYIFKTSTVANFLLVVGGFILYAVCSIIGLYILFLILQMMFTGSFWLGLLYFAILGMFGSFLNLIPMAIGLILGYPLIFISEDIEKRFYSKNNVSEGLYKEVDPQEEPVSSNKQNTTKKKSISWQAIFAIISVIIMILTIIWAIN